MALVPLFVVHQMTDERWNEITQLPVGQQLSLVGDLVLVDQFGAEVLGPGVVIGDKAAEDLSWMKKQKRRKGAK